ncbi:MAG: penicillin-binding protein 2 [Desulfobacterales bacterium]|jgi:cell division protein FtsI (penicillin-binding protein 3)
MNMMDKYFKFRILLVGIIFITAFAAIAAKAVHLQVYRSTWLSEKASDQYKKSLTTAGKRGIIYDRNLSEMAVSINVTSIAAYPARVDNPQAAAKALAGILNLDASRLQRKLASKKSFVWVKRQSTAKETIAVKELVIPGIEFVSESNRFYPHTTLAAQALGFSGIDGAGLEGIEFYYNQYLKGTDINSTVFKDALGNGFSAGTKRSMNTSGHNLVLTIDNTIQYIAESALKESVDEHTALSGLALVMNPQTGAVLALAHYPFFNPNSYAEFEKSVWRNRALTDSFEPGSTMKIFSAAAALEHGKISPHQIFFCENGAYRIGKNVVHDIRKHAWLSLQQIIKYSSNIGAVKVGQEVGARKLYRTYRDFGFGQKTGIDSPGETPGSLSHYSTWSRIDTGAISFGHGISASAIQLITAVSAIANGGNLMKPFLVREIVDLNGNRLNIFKPQKVRRVISTRTATIIRNILKTVITTGGTGVNAALDGYSACGKTGTARKLDENGQYSKNKHTASFVGFAPAEQAKIAVLVIIDEPQGKYYGGIVAAPVFRQIAQQTLNYLNVPPDDGTTKLRVSRDGGAKG